MTIPLLFSIPVAIVLTAVAANAQQLDCADFQKIADGSWTPIRQIEIPGPRGNVHVGPGTALHPGVPLMGIDFATLLDAKCK
jgi:hypothetical protein